MNNNVEEIKTRLNIVDVVGEYVRLTKAGANWKGLCPFHHEKSPSFMVNEEKQIFHCFGCNKGGDVFTFIQEIESLDFKEALKLLADKAGVQLEKYQGEVYDDKKRILAALELSARFYETQLWKGMGKEKILNYLHTRGLVNESIKKFRLGYAPNGWDNIIKFLIGRGYTIEEIAKTGLLVEKANQAKSYNLKASYYDRFRDRIMFPIMDSMGNVIGYSARVAPGGDESQAKYINTPETVVYHKSNVLYGLSFAKNAIKQKNQTLLVEGNMDVIATSQAGIENVVAVSGTALTEQQVVMLKRYAENIAMLFDMDSAGQQAARKSADLCFEKGVVVKLVVLSGVKDAAEAVQKNGKLLLEAVENSIDALEYFFKIALGKNDKKIAEGKKNIVKEMLNHIAHLENKIEKEYWVKKIAHELDVEENIIDDELKMSDQNTQTFARSQATTVEQSQSDDYFQKRSEIIRDSWLGVILSDPIVWQEACLERLETKYFKIDPMASLVLEKGPRIGFSFDALVAEIDDYSILEKVRKIYFDTRYRFTSDGVLEYSTDDLRQLADGYAVQYSKELQKEKLHSIIREIEKAELQGDKKALAKLMNEFTALSQDI